VQWIHLVQGPMVYTCDVQYSLKFHIGQDTSVINILKASATWNSVTIHSEYLLQLHIFTDMITNTNSLPTLLAQLVPSLLYSALPYFARK